MFFNTEKVTFVRSKHITKVGFLISKQFIIRNMLFNA